MLITETFDIDDVVPLRSLFVRVLRVAFVQRNTRHTRSPAPRPRTVITIAPFGVDARPHNLQRNLLANCTPLYFQCLCVSARLHLHRRVHAIRAGADGGRDIRTRRTRPGSMSINIADNLRAVLVYARVRTCARATAFNGADLRGAVFGRL